MVSRKPRRAEGARGFHLLAIAKTSAPQSPKAITAAVCCEFEDNPTTLTVFGIAEVFLVAASVLAHIFINAATSPFLQEARHCQMGVRCGKLRFPLRELLLKYKSFPVSFRPSAASGEIFGNYSARALYSLFGNTICIRPSRSEVKTRSTRRRSFSAARSR